MSTRAVKEGIEPTFAQIAADFFGDNANSHLPREPRGFPRSPLRYPGGKNRAIKAIFSFIPENETKLCSPFLGGGSIELACTSAMEVHGSDIFEPLIAFWKALLEQPEQLARKVEGYYPLSKP